MAAVADDPDLVKELLALGLAPAGGAEYLGTRIAPSLNWAAGYESVRAATALIEAGVDLDAGGALHSASAQTDHGLELIALLVRTGSDPNKIASDPLIPGMGWTPAQFAIQEADLGKLQCLVRLGARVERLDEDEQPFSSEALRSGQTAEVEAFLASAPDWEFSEAVIRICNR